MNKRVFVVFLILVAIALYCAINVKELLDISNTIIDTAVSINGL